MEVFLDFKTNKQTKKQTASFKSKPPFPRQMLLPSRSGQLWCCGGRPFALPACKRFKDQLCPLIEEIDKEFGVLFHFEGRNSRDIFPSCSW